MVTVAWRLNTALTGFRSAVDQRYPDRDRQSDGTIGDPAHQARTSDHNEDPDGTVDAWDMDVELNGRGRPYEEDVEHLKRVFEAHESSRYWIHDDQIAERALDWKRRPYRPEDPDRNKHIKHVHWNTLQARETSTAPWILEDDVTPQELLNTKVGSPALGTRTVADWLKGGQSAANKVDAVLAGLAKIAEKVDLDPDDLAAIREASRQGAAQAADDIVSRVLAGLPAGALTREDVASALREVLLTGAGPQE